MPYNVTFKRSATANVNLTLDQWELFDIPGANECVPALNEQLATAISTSRSSGEAMEKFWPTLRKYSKFGACDSEPRWVAQQICMEAFGEEY